MIVVITMTMMMMMIVMIMMMTMMIVTITKTMIIIIIIDCLCLCIREIKGAMPTDPIVLSREGRALMSQTAVMTSRWICQYSTVLLKGYLFQTAYLKI